MTADLDPRSKARLARALWLARAVMLWEQGAAVWTPVLLAAAAVAVAGLWGLFDPLGVAGHAAAVAAIALTAAVCSVRGLLAIRWPTREETRRRLEEDSRLVHAPIASLEDTPLAGDSTLWALHRQRAMAAIHQTRVGRPKAGIAAADPFAFRYALAVAAALALWARGPDQTEHLQAAFAPVRSFAVASGHAAAWVGTRVSAGLGGASRAVSGWFSPAAPAVKISTRADAPGGRAQAG
jgi:hypothetical protein